MKRTFTITLLCIGLFAIVACESNNESETKISNKKIKSSKTKSSKIKTYREQNKQLYEKLSKNVYTGTVYDDGREEKHYIFKDIEFDNLSDGEYYNTVKSLFSLIMQGSIDYKLSTTQDKVLRKAIRQLENLDDKFGLHVNYYK